MTRTAGDLFFVVRPFHFSEEKYLVTHMTHYSYDRYVPLILWGRTFVPGVRAIRN